MATLQLINNLGVNIDITDVGITIPPEGELVNNPEFMRELVQSEDLRSRITAEDITVNDGISNLSVEEGITYLSLLWQKGGRDEVSGIRVIASGVTLIAANTTVTLGTFTKFPTERLSIFLYVTDDVAGAAFAEGFTPAGDAVRGFLDRTATSDEFRARAQNANLSADRTVQWAVVAVRI